MVYNKRTHFAYSYLQNFRNKYARLSIKAHSEYRALLVRLDSSNCDTRLPLLHLTRVVVSSAFLAFLLQPLVRSCLFTTIRIRSYLSRSIPVSVRTVLSLFPHVAHMHAITMNTKEKEKYIEEFDFPYCDESSKYEKVAKIGQGTFGYAKILD